MTRRTFSVAASSAHDQNWIMRTGWILVAALLACGACDEQGAEEGLTCEDAYECIHLDCAEELDASVESFNEMWEWEAMSSSDAAFDESGVRSCAAQTCGANPEQDEDESESAMLTLLICNLPEEIQESLSGSSNAYRCDYRKSACFQT